MSSEVTLKTLGAHGGKWRRYPAYRDSEVGRIGEVPERWSLKRMDAFTSVSKHPISAELLSGQEVFHYSIPIVQEKGTGQLEDGGDIESNKTLITEQVLLVSKLNPRKGTIALASPQKAITVCSGEFVPLVPRKCVPKYLEYVYCSEYVRQLLSSRVESVTKSHQRVNPIEIYNMFWSWPSLPEQRAIASFLGRETGRIDTLIEKKERQVELLQEKRAALISHAVTKGLDPDVKMKDSGMEWLGEVPEDWKLKRIKQIASKIGSGKTPKGGSEVYSESGVTFLRSQNIHFDGLRLDDVVFIKESIDEEMFSTRVFSNDVLLNIIGEGDLKPYYKNLAKQLKIAEQVCFAENVDNNKLVNYYNYCDVVVLPSINKGEAFGLVLLEAMACAKPVIASNLPGVRGVFKKGKHGLLVQPDNVDDLANKVKAILSDKNLARKMGQAGKELVKKKYTWEKVGKRLNSIYYYVKYTPK